MRSIFLVMFLVVMGSALTLVTRAQDQSQDQNPKGVIKGIVIDEVPDYEGADFEQDPKKYYPKGYHPVLMQQWPVDKPLFIPENQIPDSMKSD